MINQVPATGDLHDPIQRHPTRAEQLDILTQIIADMAEPEDWVLDLGVGTGFVAHQLLRQRRDLHFVGLDLKQASLETASENLATLGLSRYFVHGDLQDLSKLNFPVDQFAYVVSCLTFHDLSDPVKREVIGWAAEHLRPGGVFLLYDRIRLTEPAAFPLQQSIWRRLHRHHGQGMREAATFDAYTSDLGDDNRPAALEDYFVWFRAAALAPVCLHLHGNIAIIAGCMPS